MHRHQPDDQDRHQRFVDSDRPHLLMISNHGVHEWRVTPGLPDTGGQNVFVNQFAGALAQLGYRITIANRGGYPHPRTGEPQRGLRYRDSHQRIVYLEDGFPQFVRKETMAARIPNLAGDLGRFLEADGNPVAAVISHYWDAGSVGMLWNRANGAGRPHIWVPHSLGAVKRDNVSPDQWGPLHIPERIEAERSLLKEVDAAVATSSTIEASLVDDYGFEGPIPFLPPCVDPDRFHPRPIEPADPIWAFLSNHGELSPAEMSRRKIVTEISRTDRTKRKDVLIRSFARAHRQDPDSLLVVSIDESETELAGGLHRLIQRLDLVEAVVVVGSVWDELPSLYAISHAYCTPSVMEGFGMSAQEAAASGVPVIASQLVPFATEYLLGDDVVDVEVGEGSPPLRQGAGAIVAPADDVDAFATALRLLFDDQALRDRMGAAAREITIPAFTWPHRTRSFLEAVALPIPEDHD